jgi:hypothetical protein
MTQTADPIPSSANTRQPDVTLDYGHGDSPLFPTFRRWWTRGRADVQERFDGLYEFIGAILAMLGGIRQVLFAIALSCVLAGLGMSLQPADAFTIGPRWMGVGGFLLGLVIPLKRAVK